MLPRAIGPALSLLLAPASALGIPLLRSEPLPVQAPSDVIAPPQGVEALHSAVRSGNFDEVRRLVLSGADPNGLDALGSTPLLDAAWSGNVPILSFLISRGADVNAAHREAGSTPLFYSVLTGHADAVKLLLAAGARIDTKYRGGQTVLHVACARGKADIAELLISAHANWNAKDENGNTPLDEAVLHDQLATLSVLIAHGVDTTRVRSDNGRGAMAEACIKGQADLIEPLLRSGASLTAADRFGETPLDLALAYKNAKVVRELLRLGLHLSESDKAAENAMESATLRGQVDIARALVEGGFDVNRPTTTRSTYLHDAALKGQLKMVRFLLERGANVHAVNANGATPLHDAALGGNPDVIVLLLQHGAELNAKDSESGATPLMLAASMARSEAVSALLDRGANLALRDHQGLTALDRARQTEDSNTVQLLEAALANARTSGRQHTNSPSTYNFAAKH